MDRADAGIDENSYYIQDLIGCSVYHSETDEFYGEITDVSQTGANDVWHITKDGKEFLIPAIDDIVQTVEPDLGKVTIIPIKGIFDDED